MTLLRKKIPLAICFAAGLLTLAAYYVPGAGSTAYLETMNKWQNIVLGFAFLLGLFSLFRSHYGRVRRREDGWGYSLLVFAGFAAVAGPAVYSGGRQFDAGGLTALGWVNRYVYSALASTMFAVLGFFIASAAYRAFRVRTARAAVLFAAASVLILGRVPLGQLLWERLLGWTGLELPALVQWIMDVPAVAGKRGLMVGLAAGAAVTGLRVIFGLERRYLGRD